MEGEEEEAAEGKGNAPLDSLRKQVRQAGEGGGEAQQVVLVVRAAVTHTALSASWYRKRPSLLERRATSISTRYLPLTQSGRGWYLFTAGNRINTRYDAAVTGGVPTS